MHWLITDYQKRNNHSKCLHLVWGSGFQTPPTCLLTKNMYRITILVLNGKPNSDTTKTTELKCMIAAILTKLWKPIWFVCISLRSSFLFSQSFSYLFFICALRQIINRNVWLGHLWLKASSSSFCSFKLECKMRWIFR